MPATPAILAHLSSLGITSTFIDFLNVLPGLTYLRDREGKTLFINAAYERVFHVPLEQAFLQGPKLWLKSEQAEQQERQDREVIEKGISVLYTISDQAPSGETRFWRVFRFPVTALDGTKLVAGWIIDMTRDLLTAERLSAMEQQVGRLKVLEDALDGIAQLDPSGTVAYANPILATIFEIPAEALVGTRFIDLATEEDRELLQAAFHRLDLDGKSETECRFHTPSGDVTAWIKLLKDRASQQIYLFLRDTTLEREFQAQLEQSMKLLHEAQVELAQRQSDLEQANGRLQVLATTDGLTGLCNHRKFQEELAEMVSVADRYGQPFSVLMLDIDFFKQYNDSFGHPAGDEALRQFGAILREQVRATDIAARYGGEEFGVLLRMTGPAEASQMAERIRLAIKNADWPERPITASIGVASYEADGRTAHELLEAADRALYRAKTEGRDRVCGSTI